MDSTPARAAARAAHHPDDDASLGAEVRGSLILLGLCMAVTAAVTVTAQAALTLLG